MKRSLSVLLCAAMLTLTACGNQEQSPAVDSAPGSSGPGKPQNCTYIELSDQEIRVHKGDDFVTAQLSHDSDVSVSFQDMVTIGNNIVYYEEGHDFTYGEGAEEEAHSAEEAAAHTVVTITQPGEYILRGKLSAGQIAVDLGEEAEDDPNAVVNLYLDGVDITCTVAPAVIFYNVYECGDKDNPTKDVDTSAAGANVYLGDSAVNNISGSYVARIYKPGTVELSEDGTEVEDAKKLHKYDAAFYSKMSMNVGVPEGGNGSGILNITAENEGLDSEMHLTINGGTINIKSGNDGINTNEDGVSVTTINGGNVCIQVTGETGEGDGIDSNGWLVINGGRVVASACNNSADSGIDSDMGIHIGAGSLVIASGHMLDRIEDAEQNYAVFQFGSTYSGGEILTMKDSNGAEVVSMEPANDYSVLLFSADNLQPGDYTLWNGDTQLGHSGTQTGGMGGFAGGGRPGGMMPGGAMQMPEGFDPENMPERPENFDPANMERPEMAQRPENGEKPEMPEGMEFPEDFDPENMPEGMEPPQGGFGGGRPGGMMPGGMGGGASATEKTFTIQAKENYFSGVGELRE